MAVGVSSSGASSPFAIQWNGTAWNTIAVPSPNNGSNVIVLNAVAAVAPGTNHFWAVGYAAKEGMIAQKGLKMVNGRIPNSSTPTSTTLAEYWDGRAWHIANSANVSSLNNAFNGIITRASGRIWAVGQYEGTTSIPKQTVIENYFDCA